MHRNWNDVPYAPQRAPVPYHWVILGAGTIGVIMSAPGQTIGVSAFIDSLLEALGMSRLQLSNAYLLGTGGSALLLPLAGAAYDRWGARWVSGGVAMLLGLVLIGLSQCDRLVAAVRLWFPAVGRPVLAFGVITILFLALRFFGQGVIALVPRNMVMKWFLRRRGLAAAVIGVFLSLTFSCTPLVFDWLIRLCGWRGAWGLLALIVGVGFAVFALVVYRDTPEACGLQPDGGAAAGPGISSGIRFEPEHNYTLREALGTSSFWIFNLGLWLFALYGTALTFHVCSVFEQAAMDRQTAMTIFPPAAVISVAGTLVGGALADRVPLKYLLMVMLLGLGLSAIGLTGLTPACGRWSIIVGNGMAAGLFGVLMSVTWPRFYGREHLGKITGVQMATTVFGSAVGPSVFAWCLKATGGYAVAALAIVAAAVLLLVISLWADAPRG